jgi:hypothetical protein
VPNETLLRWSHLPKTTAVFTDLLPSVQRCVLYHQDEEQARVLLLADGVYSVATNPRTKWLLDSTAEAIGRIVATHACDHLHNGPDFVQEIQGEAAALSDEFAWPGMPGVRTSVEARNDCARVLVAAGDEAAVVLTTSDSALPLGWSLFTTQRPAPILLLAVGRTILAHQWAKRADGA